MTHFEMVWVAADAHDRSTIETQLLGGFSFRDRPALSVRWERLWNRDAS